MTTSTDRQASFDSSKILGYASTGAVRQHGGKLPIRLCKFCGTQIVWCKSQRTGKNYPVNVTRGYLDQRFYMGHNFHKCDRSHS